MNRILSPDLPFVDHGAARFALILVALVFSLVDPATAIETPAPDADARMAESRTSTSDAPRTNQRARRVLEVPFEPPPGSTAQLALDEEARIIGPGMRRSFRWGSAIRLRADESGMVRRGRCEFTLRYRIRNEGLVDSAPFESVLTLNHEAPRRRAVAGLAARKSMTLNRTLTLRPGSHVLTLSFDADPATPGNLPPPAQVKLRLAGSCEVGSISGFMRSTQFAAPGRGQR